MNLEPLKCKTVLILDDEVDITEGLASMLSLYNLNVIEANSTQSYFEKLKENHIDFIVSDMHLPESNGIEVLRETRKLGYATPFVFLSGARDARAVEDAKRMGAIEFLEKPFSTQELVDIIQKSLGEK